MTIDTGKQGQPFLPFNLSKISDLRNSGFGGEIAIDGGLDKETISQAIQFPVDTLVVGHYIGGSEDPEGKYVELCQLAKLG
jgi:pentose-5-phosphate-3-epimerase